MSKVYKRVLLLSDLHCPFVDMQFVREIAKFAKAYKPDLIAVLGDMVDQKAWSRFPKDADDLCPEDEFEIATECTKEVDSMFKPIRCRKILKLGNHDMRQLHSAQGSMLPSRVVEAIIRETFYMPGWEISGPLQRLYVDTPLGRLYLRHGDETRHKNSNLSRTLGMSTAQGHTHKPELEYTNVEDVILFALTLGHCMDVLSKGARYAMGNPVGSTPAFATVTNGVPQLHVKGYIV